MATFTVQIPDEIMKREGLNEKTLQVEVACMLFDTGKMTKFEACKLCGLNRDEFDAQLICRNLPVLRYTPQMVEEDLRHAGIDLSLANDGVSN